MRMFSCLFLTFFVAKFEQFRMNKHPYTTINLFAPCSINNCSESHNINNKQSMESLPEHHAHHDPIPLLIKNATWSKFHSIYSTKFKKEYDKSIFVIISSLSIVNTHTHEYQIASIGFGTKSLPRSCITPNNRKDLIRDMHAEMLAIRGFQRFICEQIKNNKDRYLQWNNKKGKYSLKSSYDIYLYCSEVFCGDCCINHGEDSFSGAKPLAWLNCETYPDQKFKENVLRTKPGRMDLPVAKRSAILSCSDLVGLFNILGIQGKALFSMVTPIYLHKIIFDGKEMLHLNIEKGINLPERIRRLTNKSVSLVHRQIFNIVIEGKERTISSQFRNHSPEIVIFDKEESRNRQGFQLCGIIASNIEQWLNGKTGLLEGSSLKNYTQKGKISKFSQTALERQFDFYNQSNHSFKYEAILQRLKKLFGEWTEEGGEAKDTLD